MFFQLVRLRLKTLRRKKYRCPSSGVTERPGLFPEIAEFRKSRKQRHEKQRHE
jgi:hypothetical protein